MDKGKKKQILSPNRLKIHEIIFEADTPLGKTFDVLLLLSIIASVIVIMLESVASIKSEYGNLLFIAEWTFTILFSIEYLLRLYSIGHPTHYARSFYGVIDLVSILPTYLSLVFPGGQYFVVIRLLRMLRIFRILKVVQYIGEANQLVAALRASKRKILIFLFTVAIIVVIVGSAMYVIEGEENGFTNIPRSIYWAIVTLTTVGYGDISPQTPLGQTLASIIMIVGYGIIAVPTGIVTSELTKTKNMKVSTQACINCSSEGHDHDAEFCKYCGTKL
jgi:voltage-gated potassium channel